MEQQFFFWLETVTKLAIAPLLPGQPEKKEEPESYLTEPVWKMGPNGYMVGVV